MARMKLNVVEGRAIIYTGSTLTVNWTFHQGYRVAEVLAGRLRCFIQTAELGEPSLLHTGSSYLTAHPASQHINLMGISLTVVSM